MHCFRFVSFPRNSNCGTTCMRWMKIISQPESFRFFSFVYYSLRSKIQVFLEISIGDYIRSKMSESITL